MHKLARSFSYALKGLWSAFKSERTLRIHFAGILAVIVAGLYLQLPKMEWAMVVFSSGLVVAAELFNTSIERLGDELAGGQRNEMVRLAKDIAAGAVFISALTAAAVGIMIIFIPLVQGLLDVVR